MRGTKVQVRPGVWRLRVVTAYDPAGHPRQLSRTLHGTKKAADSALAAFVAEVEAGLVPVSATMTVGQLLEQWLEQITPRRSPTTIRGYRDKVRRLSAVLGRIRLAKLSAADLDRAYARWLAEGLSPMTVHGLHAVLSASLRQAVKWGTIRSAVTERASPPPLTVKPAVAADPQVIQRLIAGAESRSPALAAAITVGALTGARRGELCGLRWGDLDAAASVLHIRRAVKHGLDHRQVVVGETKTHQERRVSLDAAAVAALAMHRARAEEWGAAVGVTVDAASYMLTLDPTGRDPWKPDSLSQAFRRLCDSVGVTGLRFHDLRHFSASMLIGAGFDPRTVAGRLGHADPALTLRIYAGAIEARDRAAADAIGAILRPADPEGAGPDVVIAD